jgi:hypothetical protein
LVAAALFQPPTFHPWHPHGWQVETAEPFRPYPLRRSRKQPAELLFCWPHLLLDYQAVACKAPRRLHPAKCGSLDQIAFDFINRQNRNLPTKPSKSSRNSTI